MSPTPSKSTPPAAESSGFLGSIWNFAVDQAAGVVHDLIKAFKTLVVGLLIDTFALIAVIQTVYSYVVQWRADLVTGRLQLHVLDNQLPIPDLVIK